MSITVRSHIYRVVVIVLLAVYVSSVKAKEVPYFTVELGNLYYAVSKQTAPIAFSYGNAVYQEYCQSLGNEQAWHLAQVNDQAKFSRLALLVKQHGMIDEQGNALNDIVLIQGSLSQQGYFYARLGRPSLLIKKTLHGEMHNGLLFYPLCMAKAKTVMASSAYKEIANEQKVKKQVQQQIAQRENARTASGRFKGEVLGQYHQFTPQMLKYEFFQTFNDYGEIKPLLIADTQSKNALYSECLRENLNLPLCYEYFDKLYQGVGLGIYAINVGGHIDEQVKQLLASNAEYIAVENKAKAGDNAAYLYLQNLLAKLKQSFSEKKTAKLTAVFGSNVTSASGIVFYNHDTMIRYSITLAFHPSIEYQWQRLIVEKFGRPDFNFANINDKQVFVYTNDKQYQFIPGLQGLPEEQAYLSWLMSKPKSFFKITTDQHYLHMEYENRATYYENYDNLAATAEQYVKEASINAEKIKQQKSDAFKL